MAKTLAIGQYGLTPQQLEQAGAIKPGSSLLVNSLVNSGSTIDQALPPSLFTGKDGITSLNSLKTNVEAQSEIAVSTLKTTQTQLTSLGAISGNESPQEIAGVVLAGATQGVDNTLSTMKNISNGLDVGSLSSQANGVLKSVEGGISAVKGISNPLSSIGSSAQAKIQSLGLADIEAQAKGASAAAFSAIKKSLPELPANEPINLVEIAKSSAAKAESEINSTDVSKIASGAQQALSSGAGSLGKSLSGEKSIADNLASMAGSVTKDVQSATSSLDQFTDAKTLITKTTDGLSDAAKNVSSGISTSVSSLASGVNQLPGGQEAISSVVNAAITSIPSLPGTESLTSLTKEISTSTLNGLSSPKLPSLSGLLATVTGGLSKAASSQLQAAISSISSAAGVPIKLPTVAFNTTDRSSITKQVGTVLDNPKIPQPNLGGPSESAASTIQDIQKQRSDKLNKCADIAVDLTKLEKKAQKAFNQWEKAKKSLPQGDPKIEELRKEALSLYEAVIVKSEEVRKCSEELGI